MIPEYKNGSGSVDFVFIGNVRDKGLKKICVEFKLAHSDDLMNGYWNQLPSYMRVSGAKYGGYCILDFRGDWFDKPILDESLDLKLIMIPKDKEKPEHKNIRVFLISLSKPKTASKIRD